MRINENSQQQDDIENIVQIIGVRFRPVGKIYYFNPENQSFKRGDDVIVETTRGVEYGHVVLPNRYIPAEKVTQPLKSIIRKATEADKEKRAQNIRLAKEAFPVAVQKIRDHELQMKLIDVEYTFDNTKLLFYFTADGRVDFRGLIRDLAAIYKTRIECRQIGIRDETKIMGGLSVCGRPYCCNSFLEEFDQVSIKMAKEQNISLNTAKISGACGRLMCCLRYEHETYEHEQKRTPRVNSIVETPDGNGIVIESNVLTGNLKVKLNSKSQEIVPPKQYTRDNVKVIGYIKPDAE